FAAFHDGDDRVRGAQVDSDDFAHDFLSRRVCIDTSLTIKVECIYVNHLSVFLMLYCDLPALSCPVLYTRRSMGSPLPARRFFGVAVFALALPALVLAQEPPAESAPPAHVLSLEGIVTIERDGTLESATENMPIV